MHRYFPEFCLFFFLLLAVSADNLFAQQKNTIQKVVRTPGLQNLLRQDTSFTLVLPNRLTSSTPDLFTCDSWTFKVEIGNTTSVEKVTDVIQLPDQHYYIGGSSDDGAAGSGLVVKMDKQSNLVWSRDRKSTRLNSSH